MSSPARVRAELLRLQAYLLDQRVSILRIATAADAGRFSLHFALALDRLQALVDTTGKYGESFDEALCRRRLPETRTALSTLTSLCAGENNVAQAVQQVEGCLQTLLART